MSVNKKLSPNKPLTPEQRKFLSGLAHSIKPSVLVGKDGLCDGLMKEISNAINSHELIKIKFNKSKDNKTELLDSISEKLGIHLVAQIGNIGILFRQAEKTEDRKIKLR
ncbi:MAG TPA: YhbY family RNA-binding protein [Oligoflexia bacterium]|nr:YhbY family RNA-binding protein [Oligoflexia bacterium]HMP48517.1 YhbY family RNA-binding protein [Oligoflexia bacterium]